VTHDEAGLYSCIIYLLLGPGSALFTAVGVHKKILFYQIKNIFEQQ